MWETNLLPIDRFQTKKLISIVRGQFTTFWQIPDKKNNYNCERAIYYLLTDSRNKNYHYARGQISTYWKFPENKLQLCERPIYYLLTGSRQKTNFNWERAIYYLLTDSRQKNSNYARGQITTYWQIPDKYNNYNYVRGQLTTFWQIPAKKK